jgi:hypothetical protein
MLEGQKFIINTDHKPLATTINRLSYPWMEKKCILLGYVADYTSDVRHIPGRRPLVRLVPLAPPPAAAFVHAKVLYGSKEAASQGDKAESPSPSLVASVAAHSSLGCLQYAAMADAESSCPAIAEAEASHSPKLQWVIIAGVELLCDVSSRMVCPVVQPAAYCSRKRHSPRGLAHPGFWATPRLISCRFVWRSYAIDIVR